MLYRQKFFDIDITESSPAYQMRNLMCKLWTSFAKNREISSDFSWKPVDEELNYFILDSEQKMEKYVNKARMDFWRKIYRQWNSDFLKPKL